MLRSQVCLIFDIVTTLSSAKFIPESYAIELTRMARRSRFE